MSILDIVDLSNNNGSKNIKDYPADGYMFKATEGCNFTDKYCDQFVQQAIKAGKVWGVYHFMDGSPWQAQADYFIAATKGYIGQGILCLDYEMYGRQGSNIAKKWLDYVYQKTGVKPIIYMSESVTKEENWSEVVKADYGLWVAKYSSQKPNVRYWPSYMMWQYTDTPHDKNYFYGDKKAWNAYAGKKTDQKPQPTPSKPATPSKPVEGKIKMKTLTLNSNVYLRTAAKKSAPDIKLLKKGDKVQFNDVVLSEGYIWAVQPRTDKHKLGYIAIGKIDAYGSVY